MTRFFFVCVGTVEVVIFIQKPCLTACLSVCLCTTRLCVVVMKWVTAGLVGGLLAAVLSLLAEQCWADGNAPSLAERVIWAVNAGGEAHLDVHGIHFKKDPLEGKVGKGKLIWGLTQLDLLGCSFMSFKESGFIRSIMVIECSVSKMLSNKRKNHYQN